MTASRTSSGLDLLSRELETWLGGIGTAVACHLLDGAAPHPPEGISIRLVSAEPGHALHNGRAAPLTLSVRYLVTVTSTEVLKAHGIYGELLFAAQETPWVTLASAEEARTALTAFGLPPAPSFLIETRLTRDRDHRTAPLVRHPLSVIATDKHAENAPQPKPRKLSSDRRAHDLPYEEN